MKKTRRSFIKGTIGGIAGLSLLPNNVFGKKNKSITTIEKKLPVIEETDICVLGGSGTGVFAAIRAARLGARVSIIEKQNAFGGVATNSMVCIWHSLYNTESNNQIISGLTEETIERLKKRDAIKSINKTERSAFIFNSQELKIELDEMVLENNIKPYFHTLFSEPLLEDDKLVGVIVDNKDGRGIIKAKAFIDATGDGDLCTRLHLDSYCSELLLPPTTCAHIENWNNNIVGLIKEHGKEFNIPEGFSWGNMVPNSTHTRMVAGTRIYGVDCSKAIDLTQAEIEGRRQIRAIMDLVRKYQPENNIVLSGLPAHIGIRQTRQIKCKYSLTGDDLLLGKNFNDAIAYGSYRVDIHHQDKPGITFKYLDGREEYARPGYPTEHKRWRDETTSNPTFYQIPLRSIIPGTYHNLILAGRMFDADRIAFSGARVMVNMNQLGEAAGVAAYCSIDQDKPIFKLKNEDIRNTMKIGGSIIF